MLPLWNLHLQAVQSSIFHATPISSQTSSYSTWRTIHCFLGLTDLDVPALSNCSPPWLFRTLCIVAHQVTVSGILQARILEEVALPSSRGSSPPRDPTGLLPLLQWQAVSLPLAPPRKSQNRPGWDFRICISNKYLSYVGTASLTTPVSL